ncbi:MAG: hypothetical protein ABI051_06890 [Vicinamibacterales bacterium]
MVVALARPLVARLMGKLDAHPDRLIAVISAVLLAAYVTATLVFPKPDAEIVVGDAKHHYVQLRSLIFDHDLDFRNEYMTAAHITHPTEGAEWLFSDFTPTGHVRNYMPVGPALLWMPLYVLVIVAKLAIAWLGRGLPPTGYERSLQLVPGVTGVLVVGLATALTWRMIGRFTDRSTAALSAIAIWLGSHALYYALVSPAYSHSASMFTSALFCWYWLDPAAVPSVRRAAWLGALVGLCALMRWQDALFLLVPAWEALRCPRPVIQRIAMLAAAGAAWLVAFSPQMAVWRVLYGQPFAMPQGPSFMQWTAPHLFAVLFSIDRGLFVWSPLLIVAAAGGLSFAVRHARWRVPLIGMVAVSWYVNAAVADWWAGEAFGARRFLSLTPLFALGLAIWLAGSRHRRSTGIAGAGPSFARVSVLLTLTLANALLLLQYQLALKGLENVSPYPTGFVNMWLVRFVVPIRLLLGAS